MRPIVSVVIPTYNRAPFICRAVDSVLNQTYKDTEIIVVDDGSTDNTEKLLEKYSGLPNFLYLYQPNLGRSIARNKGAENSSGNWIMYLDSDDHLDEHALETLYSLTTEASDSRIVYANFVFFKGNETPYHHRSPFVGKAVDTRLLIDLLEGKFWLTKTGTFLIDKKLATDTGGLTTAFEPCEDLDYCIRLLQKNKASYISDIVLYVERHDGNTDELDLHQATIKICKHYLASKKEWTVNLSLEETGRAILALRLRIADVSYELDKHAQSFVYYTRVILSKPSAIFDRFIFKQLIACMLPPGLKRVIKKKRVLNSNHVNLYAPKNG